MALILSRFYASSSSGLVWWLWMSEWRWPLGSPWRPPLWLLGHRWKELPHVPIPIMQLHSTRKESESLPKFQTCSGWVHCLFLHPYLEFHSVIFSCCVLVVSEIDPTFYSSGNLWSTLISFGSQGAWWIKDDVVHICSGLNILVFDSFMYLSLFRWFSGMYVC